MKNILLKVLKAINLIIFVGIVLGMGSFWLPLTKFTGLSFLGLMLPVLVILHFGCLFIWILIKHKWAWRALFFQIICLIFLVDIFQFGSNVDAERETVSIMTYNTRIFNKNEILPISNVDSSIINFVRKENPDILFFQESYHALKRSDVLDDQYPHKFVDFIYGKYNGKVINSIFSKYPIVRTDTIAFPKSFNKAIAVDIAIGKDTVRAYNVHLQSFNVVPDMTKLQDEESSRLFKRMVGTLARQESQVGILLKHMRDCQYPIIIAGDFNNTQFSKVYRAIKADRFMDTFLEAGSGFGRSFALFGFPMRIDYILADDHFEVVSHTNYDIRLSDHYPVMARLELHSNK